MWFVHDRIIPRQWQTFMQYPYHEKPLEMAAGEKLELRVSVLFAEDNLLPPDFSIVVWAEKSPVTMELKKHDHESSNFPNYQMSDTVAIYNLKG